MLNSKRQEVLVYNIYGKITLRIETSNPHYKKYFDNEYLGMHSPQTPASESEIYVKIGGTTPRGFSTQKFKNLFTFKYKIEDIDSSTSFIWFSEHWVDKIYINAIGVYLQAQLIEPLMYLKLLEKNILFMHAGGVSDRNKAILLPAHGGTGKTTLSLKLCSWGYKLMGDDLIIVDANEGVAYPYLRPFHIFDYNLNSLEGAKMPKRFWVKIKAKNVIRKIFEKALKEEFLISTRIHANELYGHDIFGKKGRVSKIVFLIKDENTHLLDLADDDSLQIAIEKIRNSADLNVSLFENIIDKAEIQEEIQTQERKVIRGVLENVSEVTFLNTRTVTEDELRKVFGES